ncbi:hypothetical protein PSN45_001581 [Yamadazyma tenuis]|uniref:uncharacterized protein n=1 Tax=Candida tenuis TaxID=2315449 RepID=UPI0027A935A7|nr:hypothetical protein PSN45_001581 [Yamadazyma tenuis]
MDDDYSDDGSVEFSEDLLNDQEYDQLLDTLPVLKQKLAKFDKGSQINELVLKESLYDHYFEVEEALEDLKVSHKLKRTYKFSDYLSSVFLGHTSAVLFIVDISV